jgi:DNA-directed RNA polymerase specialized sigma24 family protein
MDREINATWVFHTAAHKAVDLQRQSYFSNSEHGRNQAIAQESQDPELLHLLRACAAELPAPLNEFYEFRFGQGLSQRATAAQMGLDRTSIQRMDRRCLRIMKGHLDR